MAKSGFEPRQSGSRAHELSHEAPLPEDRRPGVWGLEGTQSVESYHWTVASLVWRVRSFPSYINNSAFLFLKGLDTWQYFLKKQSQPQAPSKVKAENSDKGSVPFAYQSLFIIKTNAETLVGILKRKLLKFHIIGDHKKTAVFISLFLPIFVAVNTYFTYLSSQSMHNFVLGCF